MGVGLERVPCEDPFGVNEGPSLNRVEGTGSQGKDEVAERVLPQVEEVPGAVEDETVEPPGTAEASHLSFALHYQSLVRRQMVGGGKSCQPCPKDEVSRARQTIPLESHLDLFQV